MPSDYPQNKINNINEKVQYYKEIIVNNGLSINDIIAVSSLVDWMTPDGIEVGVEEIANLPKRDVDNLQMAFDGRYHIEELLEILEEAIQDFEAQMGLRMAARLTDVVNKLAKHLNKIFSGIAATVAVSPIPVSDIYILLILQALLVSMIASLSGRDISLETAKEFILSMGGITGAGFAFRLIAQQSVKLFNVMYPGTGSFISSAIAASGTSAIGKAAIAYYINDQNLETVRDKFVREHKKLDKRTLLESKVNN